MLSPNSGANNVCLLSPDSGADNLHLYKKCLPQLLPNKTKFLSFVISLLAVILDNPLSDSYKGENNNKMEYKRDGKNHIDIDDGSINDNNYDNHGHINKENNSGEKNKKTMITIKLL